MLVSWRPPPTELQNGIITKYAVQYTAIEGDETTNRQISDIPSQNSQYLLENLEKWTEYRVTVSAHTDVGAGPESLPQVVRTEEDGMFSKATVPVAMIVHLLTCPPFSDTNSVSLAQQSLFPTFSPSASSSFCFSNKHALLTHFGPTLLTRIHFAT